MKKEPKQQIKQKENKGITLIALVITIVVLIILAGISINLVLGENGLFTKAKEAAKDMEVASLKEQISTELLALQMESIDNNFVLEKSDIEDVLNKYGKVNKNTDGNITGLTPTGKDYEIPFSELWQGESTNSYNEKKKVNAPKIAGTGLTPVKIEADGSITETDENDTNWYNYEDKKWANAQSADGSLWVWIPRYAYKIQYTEDSDHSQGGTIDVKFLIGTTDYYEEETQKGTAKRATNKDDIVDTSKEDYYVHPAFTDESNIDYANGGWDRELTGIWVAKFEAGYTGDAGTEPQNQPDKVIQTNIKYTTIDGWSGKVNQRVPDYYYGTKTAETNMTYPTFQANRPSYNYISLSDAFTLCRKLTQSGNPYQLTNSVDSHLMKNSEWGAIAYLAWSQYGQENKEIRINNISVNGDQDVWAVTGYGAETESAEKNENESLKELLKGTPQGNWNSSQGQKASTTGNVTGIYDMSGGAWEEVACYVNNGQNDLINYNKSLIEETEVMITDNKPIANTGHSTKYVTIYPHDISYDKTETPYLDNNLASQKNVAQNTKIFGDAVRETTGVDVKTSNTGWNTNSWNDDFSMFPGARNMIWLRGCGWTEKTSAGEFAYTVHNGSPNFNVAFRAVLVP